MLTINRYQFETLHDEAADTFSVTTVCDWFALFERVAGRPARLPFDSALEIARATIDRIEARSRDVEDGQVGHLVHCQLLATERGCAPERVARATDHFIDAMPSHEAAIILLHAELGL